MTGGFLQRFDSSRRHLILLVVLLCAAFTLTGVLAFRARSAEREREEHARHTLLEMAGGVLDQWTLFVEEFQGNSLKSGMPRVRDALLSDTVMRIGELVALATPELLCLACESPVTVTSHFLVELPASLVTHSGAAPDPYIVEEVTRRVQAGQSSRFRARLRGALYYVRAATGPAAIFTYILTDEDDRPGRVYGMVLDEATARSILRLAFRSVLSDAFVAAFGAPADSLFSIRAEVAGARLLHGGAQPQFERTRTMMEPPVVGITLAVGVTPGVERVLLLGDEPRARVLFLAVVTMLIALLLGIALLQVRRELELSRLRADFIASVTHELRTPLAQIRMFTEMLLLGRARTDIDRRRALTIIDQESQRLRQLVENVLLFAKSDGGRTTALAPVPVDLAEEVRLASDSFQPLARARCAQLRLELQENVVVPVDRGALRQILVNMLDNALKYGPEGQRITIGAALFDDVARVWVDDEGPGVPAAMRERVFESFFRLPREASHVAGSGIGLAVVRQLARLHNGEARVRAAPGTGTRIMVELPGASLNGTAAGSVGAAS